MKQDKGHGKCFYIEQTILKNVRTLSTLTSFRKRSHKNPRNQITTQQVLFNINSKTK